MYVSRMERFVRAIVEGMNRRKFLALGAAGLAGVALLTGTKFRFGQPSTPTFAHDLGISPSNTGSQNRTNLVAALSHSSRSVVFLPGNYLMDNSGSHIVINNYEGKLTMEPDAFFVFTDRTRRGLSFRSGSGAAFHGLRSTFQESLPDARIFAEDCIAFLFSTDTLIKGADINGSAGAGLLFYQCVRPSVLGTTIRNTMADGLHFANCQDGTADTIRTVYTGDDGLAFVNYDDGPDNFGGQATDVTVIDSGARGITVVGQRGVTVDGFEVNATFASGILAAQDNSFNTRVPADTLFTNGTIRNAGRGHEGTGDGSVNKHGIFYERIKSVEFKNIRVYSPADRGVTGTAKAFERLLTDATTKAAEPSGVVTMTNVKVQDVPGAGFDLQGGEVHLEGLVARNIGRTGIFVNGCALAQYGKLTVENVSKTLNLRRAFGFEHNARVDGLELHVHDSQSPATGYVVKTYGEQIGNLGAIYGRVDHADLVISNESHLAYTLGNVAAATGTTSEVNIGANSHIGTS